MFRIQMRIGNASRLWFTHWFMSDLISKFPKPSWAMVSVIAKKLRDIRINQGQNLGQQQYSNAILVRTLSLGYVWDKKKYEVDLKKITIFLLCLALMDLCDEADTTNDGKISVEEYLLITRNYGIKVNITCLFIELTCSSRHVTAVRWRH